MTKPMLALSHPGGAMPPGLWYMEPKLDGMRAIWEDGRLRGRNRTEIVNPPQVIRALREHFEGYTLDGELYGGSWSRSVSVGRSTRKRVGGDSNVDLWVWDVLGLPDGRSTLGLPLEARKGLLRKLFDSQESGLPIFPIQYSEAPSSARVNDIAAIMTQHGYEGVVLKRANSPYLPGIRSAHWLKFKTSSEADVRVIDAQPGEGRLAGSLGALTVQDAMGRTFRVGTGMTDAERRDLWKMYQSGELLGRVCTIIYQDDKHIVGRFPKYVRLRVDL